MARPLIEVETGVHRFDHQGRGQPLQVRSQRVLIQRSVQRPTLRPCHQHRGQLLRRERPWARVAFAEMGKNEREGISQQCLGLSKGLFSVGGGGWDLVNDYFHLGGGQPGHGRDQCHQCRLHVQVASRPGRVGDWDDTVEGEGGVGGRKVHLLGQRLQVEAGYALIVDDDRREVLAVGQQPQVGQQVARPGAVAPQLVGRRQRGLRVETEAQVSRTYTP